MITVFLDVMLLSLVDSDLLPLEPDASFYMLVEHVGTYLPNDTATSTKRLVAERTPNSHSTSDF